MIWRRGRSYSPTNPCGSASARPTPRPDGAPPTPCTPQTEFGESGRNRPETVLQHRAPLSRTRNRSGSGEVEPRTVQLQAEEKLPVDPSPHLVSRLPIGKSLGVLQHRDQRRAAGDTAGRPGTRTPSEGPSVRNGPAAHASRPPTSPSRTTPAPPARSAQEPLRRPEIQRHPATPLAPTNTTIMPNPASQRSRFTHFPTESFTPGRNRIL